jgi:hypothetical protein
MEVWLSCHENHTDGWSVPKNSPATTNQEKENENDKSNTKRE